MSKQTVVVPRRKVAAPTTDEVVGSGTQDETLELVQQEGESDEDFAARVEAAGVAPAADDANGDGEADQEAAAREAAEAEAKAEEAKAEALRAKAAAAKAEEDAANAEYLSQAKAKAAIAEAEEKAKLDLVDVIVPKPFNLMLDNHEVVKYVDGTYPMPRKHAEHWYAKAHGVRLYEGVKAKK